jgi:hypothetical protein
VLRERVVATTTSDGLFVFSAVAPGSYHLEAAKSGYVRQEYRGNEPNRAAIEVRSATRTANLDVRLTPTGSITGRIVLFVSAAGIFRVAQKKSPGS